MRLVLALTVVLAAGSAAAQGVSPGAGLVDEAAPAPVPRKWAGDLSVGWVSGSSSAYTRRLEQFGYERDVFDVSFRVQVSLRRHIQGPLWIVGSFARLGQGNYTRDDDSHTSTFEWDSHGLGGGFRLEHGLGRRGWLIPFAELQGGVVTVESKLTRYEIAGSTETHRGHYTAGFVGLSALGVNNLGFVLRYGYVNAPVLENLFGEAHNVGGTVFEVGLNWGF